MHENKAVVVEVNTSKVSGQCSPVTPVHSPSFLRAADKSWGVLVSQTDALSQLMKKSSEDLLDGPISKLTLLIRDKQQLRKTYTEQLHLNKQELGKVSDRQLHMRHAESPIH